MPQRSWLLSKVSKVNQRVRVTKKKHRVKWGGQRKVWDYMYMTSSMVVFVGFKRGVIISVKYGGLYDDN